VNYERGLVNWECCDIMRVRIEFETLEEGMDMVGEGLRLLDLRVC
jgi:hypothetical protein